MTRTGENRLAYALAGVEARVSRFSLEYRAWTVRADKWAEENNL